MLGSLCGPLPQFPERIRHNSASQPRTPAIKSSIAVLSPRLSFERSPSASTSKGFLLVGTRVAPSTVQINAQVLDEKQTGLRNCQTNRPGTSLAIFDEDYGLD